MNSLQRLLTYGIATLGILYVGAGIYSDTIQESSRRAIEASRFGVLFRKTSNSSRANAYNSEGNKIFTYRDTLYTIDGIFQVIDVKLHDASPIDVRNAGDEISGRIITVGQSPKGRFVIQGSDVRQKITRGLLPGSLILTEDLFIGEGQQDHIEGLYRLLEVSLANYP